MEINLYKIIPGATLVGLGLFVAFRGFYQLGLEEGRESAEAKHAIELEKARTCEVCNKRALDTNNHKYTEMSTQNISRVDGKDIKQKLEN